MSLPNTLVHALKLKLEAERQEALALLQIHLTSPVGNHGNQDLLSDMLSLVNKLASSEAALSSLERNVRLADNPPAPPVPTEGASDSAG